MSNTKTTTPDWSRSLPLNVPLGQVYATREALEAMAGASIALDDVLTEHVAGSGGDCDHDYGWENYDCAADGGPNYPVHDLDEEEVAQLRVVTPPDRTVTIVSLHTEAE